MSLETLSERALRQLVLRGTRLLGKRGDRFVGLDELRLIEEAQRRSGLRDFGGEDFREPLGRLLQSYESEAGLTLLGRIAARQDTLRLLTNRLQMQEDRRRRPEIDAEVIRQPLFVTGLPRTGTTLLHGLLAQDPTHRAPLNWEVTFPSPPPELDAQDAVRRIALAERQLVWFHRLAPGFRRIHPLGARLAEECLIINSHSFRSFQFQTSHRVPSYQAWLERSDLRLSYEMHRKVLQQLQWRTPRTRWILKAPAHLYGLPAIFAVYPDARMVFTHRDPLEVVPSMASLHAELRRTFSENVEPHAVGSEVTLRWSEGIRRALQARDEGCAPADRFFDVRYADLLREPLPTVRRLYQHFGDDLSAEAEESMRRFLANSPKDKHGQHRYTLEQYGFDAEQERERYRAYRERFAL